MKQSMDRPYVICHMLMSIDGKISGEYFGMPEVATVHQSYSDIRSGYNCNAVLNGAVTAAEIYADGYCDNLESTDKQFSRDDYVADKTADHFVIAVDTEGRLKWRQNFVDRDSMPKSHVIEVLTENVSDDYIAHLRDKKVSYLFAGKEDLDVALMLRKLKSVFGIDKLMICGGGVLDWSFLQADCLDELSLVIAPVTDGRTDTASLFDRSPYQTVNVPKAFTLSEVRRLAGDGIYLKYLAK